MNGKHSHTVDQAVFFIFAFNCNVGHLCGGVVHMHDFTYVCARPSLMTQTRILLVLPPADLEGNAGELNVDIQWVVAV